MTTLAEQLLNEAKERTVLQDAQLLAELFGKYMADAIGDAEVKAAVSKMGDSARKNRVADRFSDLMYHGRKKDRFSEIVALG